MIEEMNFIFLFRVIITIDEQVLLEENRMRVLRLFKYIRKDFSRIQQYFVNQNSDKYYHSYHHHRLDIPLSSFDSITDKKTLRQEFETIMCLH